MRFNLPILAICALILVANCSPAPQTDTDDDAYSAIAERQNPPPTTATLPTLFQYLLSSALSGFSSMVSAAGSTATSALGSLTNTTFSVAQSMANNTEQFIENTVASVNNGINSMANSFSGSNSEPSRLATPLVIYPQDDFLYKIDDVDPFELDK